MDKDMIVIDFETDYSATYSVSEMGYFAYTHDDRFNAYMVAWVDAESRGAVDPRVFDWRKVHGKTVVAHNAAFDKAVFDRLKELRVVPPNVSPAGWLCTSAMSAYCQHPRSLKDASWQMLGVRLDKAARDKASGQTGDDLFGSMADYAVKDAEACAALWDKAASAWPRHERELWLATVEMGAGGVRLDIPHLEAQKRKANDAANAALAALPWRGGDQPTSLKAMERHFKDNNLPLPPSTSDDDPQFLAWRDANSGSPAVGIVAAMQAYRRANRTLNVLVSMQRRLMPNGRMEAHIMYFGAFTGRWSGGGHGLNMQNFNSGSEYGDIRGCIVPEPGHKLVVVDLAQIEARILLWLAGDDATLALIRGGMSVYEAHARATMGWAGGTLKQEDPGLYKLAKCRVLGLGYGCGTAKFKALAKAMAGLDLTDAESKRIVGEYRESNPGIVELWRHYQCGFDSHDKGRYDIRLKSGRWLTYRNIDKSAKEAEQVKGVAAKVYGGLITENVVQATARDVFANRLLALRSSGFKPIMLVHDEYVFERPEADADANLQEIMGIIRQAPAWAAGLPVECEGQLMERYGK